MKIYELEIQVKQLEAALKAKYHINTASPLFEGLVGFSIGPGGEGCLLATLAKQRGELDALKDLLEYGWGVIANAYEGDWDRAKPDWKAAATRFRDRYHYVPVPLEPVPVPDLIKSVVKFLNDSSWAQYGSDARAVEMKIGARGTVQCGLAPFRELVRALESVCPNWRAL